MFATGITRSWELLGLRGGGPLDLLAQRLGSTSGGTTRRAEDDTPPLR